MKTLLAARSSFSFLNSLLNIPDLVITAKQRGYAAIVLSDVEVLYGANLFFKECKNQNIKPLFAMEISIDGDIFIVLAKNNEGFKQLMALSHKLSSEPISLIELSQNTSQCIVIYSTERSKVEPLFLKDELDEALEMLFELKKYFRDFRVGFSLMQSPLFQAKNKILIQQAQQNGFITLALELAYYQDEDDEGMLKVIQAIDQKVTLGDSRLISQPFHSILSSESRDTLYDSQTIQNTNQLSDECQVDLSLFKTTLPIYQNDYRVSSETFLEQLSKAGLKRRFNDLPIPQKYLERLNYELEVIIKMGYENYFLIVYDFILFAKKNDILVGPGRGSAATSLVAYSLGITEVDPLKYDLIFERFLNPERISMPDIDTDFEDTRRDEVIDYVRQKYGDDHVAHIITFSTLSQKQVIRDVGKVLGAQTKTIDLMSKAMVSKVNTTLKQSLEESAALRELINTRDDARRVFEVALKLEGLPRQRSVHAAGIVMSQLPLSEVIPTVSLADESMSTQYTMEQLEAMGLVKMDFLGLKNLSILSDIKNEIKLNNPEFELNRIPTNDSKTFRLIASGYTLGLFQLESDGMKQLIKQMQPDKFMDIVDAIALYRPGPMQYRSTYIENRKNPEKIPRIHQSVDPILKSTYGILIYQEQVLQIAREFAGFSYGKADILRKAMSKKNQKEMDSLKVDFLEVEPTEVASQLWTLMEQFASYGFNKAHSVSYAMITYQMAYLKANYPLLFYKALLNSVIGSSSKLKAYTNECKSRKIKLLEMSINMSYAHFTLQEGGIRLGLSIIKGIGVHTAQSIEKIRYEKGLFKNYIDCVARLNQAKINQSQIEKLIYAGAFDEFNYSRATMIHNLPEVLNYAEIIKVELDHQIVLDMSLIAQPTIYQVSTNRVEYSRFEQEALGFHFSAHPVLSVKQHYPMLPHQLSNTLDMNGSLTFYASVLEFKEIKTKKGDLMAFLTLEDENESAEAILFPNEYKQFKSVLNTTSVFKVSGYTQVNQQRQEKSFIIKKLERIET